MTTSDIDAVFDLATTADPTSTTSIPGAANTPTTPTNTPEDDADASSADEGGALYPLVLKTLTQSEAGEGNPEGTLTIAEFAGHLTVAAIQAGKGVDGIVDKANIYTGVKAKRHPLPVVLVFPDDADQSDLSNAKVYLPVKEATEAYENRPARGEGSANSSKKDQDALLLDAAKRSISLANVTKRYKRVAEQKAKAEKLLEKSHSWLKKYYVADTLNEGETQDEANKRILTEAIVAKAAEIEKEEAKKAASEKTDTE